MPALREVPPELRRGREEALAGARPGAGGVLGGGRGRPGPLPGARGRLRGGAAGEGHSSFRQFFEDQASWLACHCCVSVVAELMHMGWHTVGGICRRIGTDLERARGRSRLEGLHRLGVDEASHKKGHRYMTVAVDHDVGAVVWAARGCGKAVLKAFSSCSRRPRGPPWRSSRPTGSAGQGGRGRVVLQ